VKILKLKTLTTISITLILTLALVQNITAQASDEMKTFFDKEYTGISIRFNATQETRPSENMTINLWINCTANDVNVECLTLDIYGFRYGKEKILLKSVHETAFPLVINHIRQFNYTVQVPHDVWDATYAELYVKYTVVEPTPLERNPIFSITIVRNVYLEQLEDMFKNLNHTYCQLNQTFWECFRMNLTKENLDRLNQSYLALQQNYTSVQGTVIELGNTRMAMIILSIITIFFVATTLYVVMRKPKQYW